MVRASLQAGDPAWIGQYRLIARLGAGGMGVVYHGVSRDGLAVAVKVLRPELADDPDFRRRFHHEVSALMRVRGACTVRVIQADTEAPRPYMVTEYAEGPSLAEYLDSHGALDPEMLYRLATGLAEALTVIHAAGVIHRDLKPANVILTDAGPKVIDFGIAQALDATFMTQIGMMVGSAAFMAPEQISGHAGPPADIFVWGVTIAYAAAGESPFGTGETHAILYRVVNYDPDITAVPGPLRPLVAAALAKDPASRPTAWQLLTQLTTNPMRVPQADDSPTEMILPRTWPVTEPDPSGPYVQGAKTGRISRRVIIGVPALTVAALAVAMVLAMLPRQAPRAGLSASEGGQARRPRPSPCPHTPDSSRAASSRRSSVSSPWEARW